MHHMCHRPYTEIGALVGSDSECSDVVLEPITPRCRVARSCFSEALKADVERVIVEQTSSQSAQRVAAVLDIFRDSLVGRSFRMEDTGERPTSGIHSAAAFKPAPYPLPSCTVYIKSVEFVSSYGQGTNVHGSEVAVVVSLKADPPAGKPLLLAAGHPIVCSSLFEWLLETPGVDVICDMKQESRFLCRVNKVKTDVFPALCHEDVEQPDLYAWGGGEWLKTYTVKLVFSRWVAKQPDVVRNAIRLLKLWAHAVRRREAARPLKCRCHTEGQSQINTCALTVLAAAVHAAAPANDMLELCAKVWTLLAELDADTLVVVTLDEDWETEISRGPRNHYELVDCMEFHNYTSIYGLAVEDVSKPGKLYTVSMCGCSSSLLFAALGIYSACALARLPSAQSWPEILSSAEAKDCADPVVAALARNILRPFEAAPRCPTGHVMDRGENQPESAGVDLDDLTVCSICDAEMKRRQIFMCIECDFDLCEPCVLKRGLTGRWYERSLRASGSAAASST